MSRARVEVIGTELRLAEETDLVLFRIAQEALRNVRKHSGASEVVVRLSLTEGKVRLRVHDNGGGFELGEKASDFADRGSLGLMGMQERVRLIGGRLAVQSQPGRGTTITVEVRG